jgi:formylglycine-generating enzyme required for sulfatase activity
MENRVPAYYTEAAQTNVYRAGQLGIRNDWVRWDAGYRLPTEAEWEYACRAGTTTRFSYGDDPGYANLAAYAWYSQNSGVQRHPVGQKEPNAWGLYDMAGNVREWCWDWYGSYNGEMQMDSRGPSSGSSRVLRGGGYRSDAIYCRSAHRDFDFPANRRNSVGFRSVLSPGQP